MKHALQNSPNRTKNDAETKNDTKYQIMRKFIWKKCQKLLVPGIQPIINSL